MVKTARRSILLICLLIGLCRLVGGQQPELVAEIGHAQNVLAIVFSPDGKTLASASDDNTIKLWDVSSGIVLRTLRGHASKVITIVFSPDGKTLVSGSGGIDNSIKIWDIEGGKEIRTIKQENSDVLSMAFSPDGKVFASGTGYGNLDLWDVETGNRLKVIATREPNKPAVAFSAVVFSPDGKLVSGDGKGQVIFWDAVTGKKIKTLKANDNGIKLLALTPDGKTLVTSDAPFGRKIQIWDVESGKLLRTIENYSDGSIAVSPDGKLIAGGGRKTIWDLSSGEVLREIEESIKVAAFSPDGKILAGVDYYNHISLSDVETGKEVKILKNYYNRTESIFFSPGNIELITGNTDNSIQFWGLAAGTDVRMIKLLSLDGAIFSPDGKTFTETESSNYISIRYAVSGDEIKRLESESRRVRSVAFSPDGKILASGGDANITLWDTASYTELKILKGHTDDVDALTFSPNGKTLASGDSDGNIKLWSVADGRELKNLKPEELRREDYGDVEPLLFSPQGSILAYPVDGSGSVALWNIETDSFLRMTGRRHAGGIQTMSFSSDGMLLATGATDGAVKLWDTKTGQQLRSLSAHFGIVRALSFNRGGKILATGGDDNLVKVWDADSGKQLCTLFAMGKTGDWLVTTPEGFFDGTPAAWKQILWRFNNNTFDVVPVETYFNDFFYPNLLQDVFAGKSPHAKAGQELEKIDRRQPKVEISSVGGQSRTPQLGANSSTGKRTATVVIEVADNNGEKKRANHNPTGGAQDLRLFRNGSLVKRWSGSVFDGAAGCEKVEIKAGEPRRVRCRADVMMTAGENNFTAYAFNSANVKSNDDAVSIKGEFSKKEGTLYVLAIGVNKYAAANLNLNFAVPDIVDISKAIEAEQNKLRGGGNLKQYAETKVVTLKDETATKENILLALDLFSAQKTNLPETLCAKLTGALCAELKTELAKIKPTMPEDALVIYYAGHGTSREQRFYLVPHNFTNDKTEESLIRQSVSDIELNQSLERVDAGKILMVIDACQSGQALGAKTEGRAPMNSKGLAQLAYDKGMLILTATQSQEAANEAVKIGDKEIRHGLLTFALLEAMRSAEADKDADKKLIEREWFDYAVEQVPLLQRAAMTQRNAEIIQTGRGVEIIYVKGDKTANPNDRLVQTPRVFYRRETDNKPFLITVH